MIGQTVSHFRIDEKIGEGGMGVVYRAQDTRLDRPVALKFLPAHLGTRARARTRFIQEAKSASALDHPNICTIYEIDEAEEEALFIAMAYYAGQTVAERIEAGPLSVTEAVEIARQVASGLSAAHNRGIVHRDIKPANLIVTSNGLVKILDFGIAKLAETTGLTHTGRMVGTLSYASPESAGGEETTAQTDVWSLGVVLYEMLAGGCPFDGPTAVATLYRILGEAPTPIGEIRDDVPGAIQVIVDRSLAKSPDARYGTMSELLTDLDACLGTVPATTTQLRPTTRRRREATLPPYLTASAYDTTQPESAPFAGRQSELDTLNTWLDEAIGGHGRVAFITGEAGSGKSILAREFCRRAGEENDDLIVAIGSCDALTGIGDPYHPFREVLASLTGDVEAQWAAGSLTAGHATRLWGLLPTTVEAIVEHGPHLVDTFVAGRALLKRSETHFTDPGRWLSDLRTLIEDRPAGTSAAQTDLLDQYVRVILELAHKQPLLLVIDDVHWVDSGSAALLFQLGRRLVRSRVLILALYRPSEIAQGRDGDRHLLRPVIAELCATFGDSSVGFDQAGDRAFVDALVDAEPNRLDETFREALHRQTRGHALFSAELLADLKERGLLIRDEDNRWVEGQVLDWSTLPARVEAAIGARIARLPDDLRQLLSLASVEGEEFTLEALAALQGTDVRSLIGPMSGELEKRHQLVQAYGLRRMAGGKLSVYRFRHILFQQFLYDQLDEIQRSHLHEQLANALEALHGDQPDEIAVKLAHHFAAAGLPDRAAHYLLTAGKSAIRTASLLEATAHLESSLAFLATLPVSDEREGREFEAQLALGSARHLGGSPDFPEPFRRALQLAEASSDLHRLGWALWGSYWVSFYAGDHEESLRIGKRMLPIAEEVDDRALRSMSREILGRTSMMLGDLPGGLAHYEALISEYSPRDLHPLFGAGLDQESVATGMIALVKLEMGYCEEAVGLSRHALDLAKQKRNSLSLTYVLAYDVFIHLGRRDFETALRQIDAFRAAAEATGTSVMWDPEADLFEGICLAHTGETDRAIELTTSGLRGWDRLGWRVGIAYFTALGAEALSAGGRPEEGLQILDHARSTPVGMMEQWRESDILEIRGRLFQALPEPDLIQAEAMFREAIEMARAQSAKWAELRSTMSLSRLLRDQQREAEARAVLADIYEWFTEGFDTPDLQDAKALLLELGGSVGVG